MAKQCRRSDPPPNSGKLSLSKEQFVGAPRPARQKDSAPVQYYDHSVPCIRFQTLFTLISKYFSSFVHTTCSLSVSQEYLALDEIYHPIRPGVPTKTTLRKRNMCCLRSIGTGLSPSLAPNSYGLPMVQPATNRIFKLQFGPRASRARFQI